MKDKLTEDQARRLRFRANGLLYSDSSASPAPEESLERLCGVQAQELPAGLLSLRARSPGITASEIEQARQVERTIVRTWLMRGTLHLASAADVPWLVPLLGPTFIAADRRRMAELGWDETLIARGLQMLNQALAGQQGLTRPEIAGLLRKEGLPHEGQATVHLIARAALEGALCQGPDRGKQTTYVRFAGWAGPLRPRPRPEALADLALRYLGAFAPAGPRDFAGWSGLPLGEARQAWQAIEGHLIQAEIAGQPAWMLKTQLPWLDELEPRDPAVRLLPRFDTYLLGYASRDLAVEPAYARRIHPGGGILRAGLAVDGRVLGLWSTQKRRKGLVVTVEPFQPLPAAIYPGLEEETAGVGRFLGVEVILRIEDPR